MATDTVGSRRTPRGQVNETGSLTGGTFKKFCKKRNSLSTTSKGQQTNVEVTSFRRFYDRSDLPVAVTYNVKGPRLKWTVEVQKLDYHHYLPLFFEGLRETTEPYATIATQGTHDMLEHAPARVVNTVPQLILPIKKALDTRNPMIICRTLKAVQRLVETGDMVGEALVPYYRQILPALNAHKSKNLNTGDGIVYGQGRQEVLGDLIEETLQLLERSGGEDAFINIKYMIPTYESCVLN